MIATFVHEPIFQPIAQAITAALGGFNPRTLFADGSIGVLYDNNDFVDSATWRRNLLTYTDEWTSFQAAAGTKSVTSGVLFFTETAVASIHELSCVFGIVSGTTYTYQVKAKADLRGCINLGNSGYILAKFNLRTGAVNFTSGGNPWFSGITASISNTGDGYYQCAVTATCTSNQPAANWRIGLADNDSDATTGQPTYLGVVGYGVYLKDIQLETGSTATTYQRITDFNSDFLAAFPNTTLFADAAGTTPAVVNGPVGLQLDKSQGLVLGAELVTNGGFDTDTAWTKGAGWTIAGGSAVAVNASSLVQTSVLVPGKWYRATVVVSSYTSGILYAGVISDLKTLSTGTGTKTVTFLADSASFYLAGLNAFNGSVDSVTVRELAGNHRYQSTATSRPTLRGTPNGLDGDGTDDSMLVATSGGGTTGFLFQSAIKLDAINKRQALWSDAGTNTGYKVEINASNQLVFSAGNGTAYTSVTTANTVAAGTTYSVECYDDGTNLVAILNQGTPATATRPTVSAGTAGFTMQKDNGAASGFMDGTLYSVIYLRNTAKNSATRAASMRWIRQKAGL